MAHPLVLANDRRIQITATSGQLVFSADYLLFDEADVTVKGQKTGASEETFALGDDYTVSGTGNAAGFTITFLVARDEDEVITIEGTRSIRRLSDFQTGGDFLADTLNDELDIVTVTLQELQRNVDRAIQLASSTGDGVTVDLPAPEAGKFLAWNSTATALENRASVGSGLPTAHNNRRALMTDGSNTGEATDVELLSFAASPDTRLGVHLRRGSSGNFPYFRWTDNDNVDWYIHVDTSGRLRTHTAIPTADLDGSKIGGLEANEVQNSHMSANSVDSDQYVDASIDPEHLSADVINSGALIADNVIDSEHYVDGSIDDEHIADAAKIVSITIPISDLTTPLTTGTSKGHYRMPFAMTLTEVRAALFGAGSTSGVTTFDINESGTTILSTKLSIDQGEKTSETAATPAVISDTALADDAELLFDIDAVTGGADEVGASITLIGYRT